MFNNTVDLCEDNKGRLLKKIVKDGSGEVPPMGSIVTVHYDGYITGGKLFDSTREPSQPLEFCLGKTFMVKGWHRAIGSMKKGERAIFIVGPKYGFDEASKPEEVPPNTKITYDIEVLDWKYLDLTPEQDGGIERCEILKFGEQDKLCPKDRAVVDVHLVGQYEDKTFDERDVTFTVGEASEANVIKGIDIAVKKMFKEETSRLKIKPSYAFGEDGHKEWGIPPNAIIYYTVTLKSLENCVKPESLTSKERVLEAEFFKEKGTEYYNKQNFELAFTYYKRIEEFLAPEKDISDDLSENRNALLLAGYLNTSLVALRLKEYGVAKDAANIALKMDSENEKAFFRCGQALLALKEPDLALQHFDRCLEIKPDNKAALAQRAVCIKESEEMKRANEKTCTDMLEMNKMDINKEQ